MATDDDTGVTANDLGGEQDMLSPMESTDSDELRNDDGDEVVDPPDDWTAADKIAESADGEGEGETLDERLAAEVPDVTPAQVDPRDADTTPASDEEIVGGDLAEEDPGEHRGQIDGTPEDGESLFPVVDE